MSRKIKTITLAGPFERLAPMNPGTTEPAWEVIRVTDSIEFSPKQYLDRSKVDELCESSHWKVTIVAKGS